MLDVSLNDDVVGPGSVDGGIRLRDGVCAVVESAEYAAIEPNNRSKHFIPEDADEDTGPSPAPTMPHAANVLATQQPQPQPPPQPGQNAGKSPGLLCGFLWRWISLTEPNLI